MAKKKTATKKVSKRSPAKSAKVVASPAKADIGKRRTKKWKADEIQLPVTAPVRMMPKRRSKSFHRELPLLER